MKKVLLPIALCLSMMAAANAPQTITYQAVVRNDVHKLVRSKAVGVRISILKGSEKGTVVYKETRRATTNPNGLLTFAIGDDDAVSTYDLSAIKWEDGPFFIKCEMDPTGGTKYTLSSTSQLLSVPYALYAERISPDATPEWTQTPEKPVYHYSEIVGAPEMVEMEEKDPLFKKSVAAGITAKDTARWNKQQSKGKETDPQFSASPAAGITKTDISNWNKKLDKITETDPAFQKSVAAAITKSDTTRWNKVLKMPASVITNVDIARWNNKLDSVSESDPVFTNSVASTITKADLEKWNSKLAEETDPTFSQSVASGITAADTSRWNNTDRLRFLEKQPANSITTTDIANWNSKLDGYTETDPTFSQSVASGITAKDTIRWNEAANLFASKISADDIEKWNNKLDDYTETDPAFSQSVASGITTADTARWNNTDRLQFLENQPANSITTTDIANWNKKLESESDPEFAKSLAAAITATDTARWNGFDRSPAKSISNNDIDNWNRKLSAESDPEFSKSLAAGITASDTARWNKTQKQPASKITDADIERWNNKLDNYTESDPAFAQSVASGITATDTARWNKMRHLTEKLAGDISDIGGGLTEESDPHFAQSVASAITVSDTARWNKFNQSAASKIKKEDIDTWNNKLQEENDPVYKQSVAAGIGEVDTARWNRFDRSAAATITEGDIEFWNDMLNYVPTNISFFDNDAGYVDQKTLQLNNSNMYYMMLQIEKYYEDSLKAVAKVRIKKYVDSVVTAENKKLDLYKQSVNEQLQTVTNMPASGITNENINIWNNKLDKEQLPEWAKGENKPVYNYTEIADVPTKVSAFENDAQYITKAEFDNYKDSIGNVVNSLKEETEELRRLVNGLLARETKQRILLDLTAGDGGSVVGKGYYTIDSLVTITAVPDSGYEFVRWDDDVTTAERQVKVDREGIHLYAEFKKSKLTLTVSAEPEEAGTVTGGGKYDYMTEVTVTAIDNPGYTFVKWSDGGKHHSHKVKVDADKTVTAIYTKN